MDELLTFTLLRASLWLSQRAFIGNLSQGKEKGKRTKLASFWRNALTAHWHTSLN